ncbi:MAG: hypothetical protein IKV39_01005 [Clostridia bacterium]|nr:hypothetical protein [Clostridia bacterium]
MKNITSSYIVDAFLSGMQMKVHLADGRAVVPNLTSNEVEDSIIWSGEAEGVKLTVTAKTVENSTLYSADIESESPLAARAVTLAVDTSFADAMLDIHDDTCPVWKMSGWSAHKNGIEIITQNILAQKGEDHISITCLMGDLFRSEMDSENGLYLWAGMDGFTSLHGSFLAVTADSDPIKAVEKNYRFAHDMGAIKFPLRDGREYPEMFENFGWCSWNAFYQQPTSEKIYQKLDEFKEKNIPVKWMIIDDGWSPVVENQLQAFEEDREKFPEGLKECIRRIKEDYGIKYVGVWHTLHAYWWGVDAQSKLGHEMEDCLFLTNCKVVPINDPEKQYKFWDTWHSYLRDCGVDFVKVDNQSTGGIWAGNDSTVRSTGIAHETLERSVKKNFDGNIINCMGMDMEDVFTRPFTAVSRNSDDFFPHREDGFAKHLQQNIYNAIWHSQVMHCDYDMWWSGKSDPVQSGLLRAISGGPIYISDAIGDTNLDNILPVAGANGDICRLDHYAMPTYDCIYENCRETGRIIKTYNCKNDSVAVALFNICKENVTETFSWSVVPDIKADTEYVAYEYFTKKFTRIAKDSTETVSLGAGDVRAYSIYPIIDGEYINFGDCTRYIGIGARETKRVNLSEIL